MQEFLFRQIELFGNIGHDTHIGLMADEICQVVQRIAILFQEIEYVLRHIGTSLDKDVASFRHHDSPVARTKMNRIRSLAQITKSLSLIHI